jgi:hypothetical protein
VADGPKPDGDLRGAAGPRLEWVTKPPADLGLTDMAMSNGDLTKFEGGKPPPTAFPSGTKSLDLVARFKSAPPDGTRITAEVRGRAGSVGLKGGPLITSQNNATGEFDVLLMCSPKNGDYADGPYQTRVIVNGAETALLNWSVGGAAAPAPPEPPAARGDLPEVMEWHRIKTFNLYVSGGGTVSPSNSDDVFVGVKVRLPAKLIGGAPRNGGLDYTFTNFDCVLKFPDGSKRSASGLAREKGNYDANYYVQHADYGKTETDPPSFVRWVLFAVPRKQLEAGGLKFSFKGCPAVPLTAEGRTEDRDG